MGLLAISSEPVLLENKYGLAGYIKWASIIRE